MDGIKFVYTAFSHDSRLAGVRITHMYTNFPEDGSAGPNYVAEWNKLVGPKFILLSVPCRFLNQL
jgi:hypothetical protein